jgi:hypothetical protein
MIHGLHAKWKPHPGQVKVFSPLFKNETKELFIQAGRNFGKTEGISYVLWRFAYSNPRSENYYFAPYMKQAREILWASGRMQNFGPEEWITSINNTEMRISFTNGSFIKLDGSDNVDAYRGVKPKGITVFDEFKDFRPEFYTAYDPNRAAHDSPLIIIGTPPDRDCQFTEVAEEFKRNPNKRWFKAPSSDNPHISKEWLENKQIEHELKGEEDVWQREYLAEIVKGGANKVFPMMDKIKRFSKQELLSKTYRDRKKLKYYVIADPAAASVFAVLFLCINPYSKEIVILDELYETDQYKMTVEQIGKRILQIRNDIYDGDWTMVYDEAETWFANEFRNRFSEYWIPSTKSLNDKEHGLSLIKDIILKNRLFIAIECVKLYWELDNYYKDKNGKIPKTNDHLIDCFRYALGADYYELNTQIEQIKEHDPMWRGATIEQDFPNMFNNDEINIGDLWKR